MLCHTHTISHCMTKWFFYAESWTGHLQPSYILCLGSGHLVSGPGEEESLKKYFLLSEMAGDVPARIMTFLFLMTRSDRRLENTH